MLDIIFWFGAFALTLFALIKSADFFIDASEKISEYLGVPPFLIGITIVALGTSLPELAVGISAVLKGSSEIVIGNVIGSNITNILLILGVVAIVGNTIQLKFKFKMGDLIAMLGSAIFLLIAVRDGDFSTIDTVICLSSFCLYLVYILRRGQSERVEAEEGAEPIKLDKYVIPILLASIVGIYFSAEYNIISIQNLAELLDIGPEIISLTTVALGTSMPELFVSLSAIKSGNVDMAIGNIMGSNIFNILAVMGIPALVGNLTIPPSINNFSIYIMVLATVLYFVVVRDKQIRFSEGIVLLVVYGFFLAKILFLGV